MINEQTQSINKTVEALALTNLKNKWKESTFSFDIKIGQHIFFFDIPVRLEESGVYSLKMEKDIGVVYSEKINPHTISNNIIDDIKSDDMFNCIAERFISPIFNNNEKENVKQELSNHLKNSIIKEFEKIKSKTQKVA